MYMCVYLYIYIHISIYTHIHIYIYIYIYLYSNMHACIILHVLFVLELLFKSQGFGGFVGRHPSDETSFKRIHIVKIELYIYISFEK